MRMVVGMGFLWLGEIFTFYLFISERGVDCQTAWSFEALFLLSVLLLVYIF